MDEDVVVDFDYTFDYFSRRGPRNHVQFEHTYYDSNADDKSSKSVKYLFSSNICENNADINPNGNEIIDVEGFENEVPLFFLTTKKFDKKPIEFTAHDERDWTEKIDRKGWNITKFQLFRNVVTILEADYLTRLSSENLPNEIVRKRIMTNKTALRFRRLFASVSWNIQLLQWIHGLLIEHLPPLYLTSYQEALQCLETKVHPHLVENITSIHRFRPINSENHNLKTRKSWDPFSAAIKNNKLEKLPGGLIFLMVPFNASGNFVVNTRPYHWFTQFSQISKAVSVPCSKSAVSANLDISALTEQLVNNTRTKISEIRSDYPSNPIVLVGIDAGSAIACHVALFENVLAVVCLGFPLFTIEGIRGTPDDKLLNLQTNVLFIIGQNAGNSSVECMQELRTKMKCDVNLVVVGDADDQLRISHELKMKESVTQSIVDRCILNEVGSFLYKILISPEKSVDRTSFMDSIPSKKDKKSIMIKLPKKNNAGPSSSHKNVPKKPRAYIPKKISNLITKNKEWSGDVIPTDKSQATSENLREHTNENVATTTTATTTSNSNTSVTTTDSKKAFTFENSAASRKQQSQQKQVQQSKQPQENLFTHMEFEVPSETVITPINPIGVAGLGCNGKGSKKMFLSNQPYGAADNDNSTISHITIRDGSVSVDTIDLTAVYNEYEFSNLPSYLKCTKNQYEPFKRTKRAISIVGGVQGLKKKSPKTKDPDIIGIRRPYVRRNAPAKTTRMQKLSPIRSLTTSAVTSRSLAATATVNIVQPDGSIIEEVSFQNAVSITPVTNVAGLTPDNILELPVFFEDNP